MNLPNHLVIFCTFALAFSVPDLERARARLNEVRARAEAHRAKLRADSSRITQHLNQRHKRQEPQYQPPPPPYPPSAPPPVYEEEPFLIHICSAEDEGQYGRNADLGKKEAEAHLHSHVHSHFHGHSTSHLSPFSTQASAKPQTVVPEFVVPQTVISPIVPPPVSNHLVPQMHVPSSVHTSQLIPALNLNINQQQQALQPSLNQGHAAAVNNGHGLLNQGNFLRSGHEQTFENSPTVQNFGEATANLGGEERAARPNLLLKKKMSSKLYKQPSYNYYYTDIYGTNYGSIRENNEEDSREANPTFHLKKKLKKLPVYYPVNNQPLYYKEADGSEEDNFDSRQASPTLLMKKLHLPIFYPQNNQGLYYKEAEDFEDENQANREANPTLLHKKKLRGGFYPANSGLYNKEAEDEDTIDKFDPKLRTSLKDLTTSSYLFDVEPARNSEYKRSLDQQLDELLGMQRKIVETLHNNTNEDLRFIGDITNSTLTHIEERHRKISKRSLPLTRLISDPRAKLDVPKTFENFGAAAKNAFEDDRAPLYHFKHMIGSSKNAILSAMKIPNQNIIVPTDYQIVKSEDVVGESEPSFNDPFARTFKRVGQIVRDSIKSGQEAAHHLGEMAHSARNVVNTARYASPRLIIPYAQIPAIQDSSKKPSKAVLITPRILDLAHETSARKAEDNSNFVPLGQIMDAVGISEPGNKPLGLHKIIFEPRRIPEAKVDERVAKLFNQVKKHYGDVEIVGDALSTLEDAKHSIGAKNLHDLVLMMKQELSGHHKKSYKTKKQQEAKEMGKFVENLFDGKQQETVGSEMLMNPELLHPFMGRASKADLKKFFNDFGDKVDDTKIGNDQHADSLGTVLGAVNPLMFERLFNESVSVEKNDVQDELKTSEVNKNENVGTSFGLTQPMMKPFMGQIREKQLESFLETYNKDKGFDYEEVQD